MSRWITSRLRPLDPADVTFGPGFWQRRRRISRRATIPHVHDMLASTGALAALRMDWRPGRKHRPHPFYDSDVAKWLEGACHSLATDPDPVLARKVDRIVALLGRAQQDDGYLNSYITQVEPDARWANLRHGHELYCAGHLIEAGVAHHRATGETSLLDVVCRYADLIADTFGPGRSKRGGYPGHEEIELALVKLYRATGRRRYLDLSRHFVDVRGRQPYLFAAEARAAGKPMANSAKAQQYWQAHLPVRQQDGPVGHAVRGMYLYSAMANLAGETHDAELMSACRRLWDALVGRQMYVTGGIGQTAGNEGFTCDYDLPNDTAYAETCAAIGLVFWAQRMANLTADARYADVMERALYNGVLSGVSLDGKGFFYTNSLAAPGPGHWRSQRQEWFACACCPTNVVRLIASLGAYVYAAGDDALAVHLYVAGQSKAQVGGTQVTIRQETDYPWDGRVRITVTPDSPAAFDLLLRVPGWCRKHRMRVNGRNVRPRRIRGYARLSRRWQSSDMVELAFEMPVERIAAHPDVSQNAGRVALKRGPIVYCLEQPDHSANVHSIALPRRARLEARFEPGLLGGAVVLHGSALAATRAGWAGRLYRPHAARTRKAAIRAIPYCLWANRRPEAMTVWIPQT